MSISSEDEKLWGEIPREVPCLSTFDQEKFLHLLKSITEKVPVVVGQQMFLPPDTSKTVHWTTECPDSITIHTVQLQEFINDMNMRIEKAEVSDIPEFEQKILPPCPEIPSLYEDHILSHNHPRDITSSRDSRKKSDFNKGKCESPPLPFHIIRQQQEKALSALLAKIGFFSGEAHTFDVLIDVLHEFYIRVTKLLRQNVDREAMTGNSVFIDVVEQTFQQLGLGSIIFLHDFYKESVINHHEYILEKCKSLVKKYEKLRSARPTPTVENELHTLEKPSEISYSPIPVISFDDDHYAEQRDESDQQEESQDEKLQDESKGTNSMTDDSLNWVDSVQSFELDPHIQLLDFTDMGHHSYH